MKEETNLTTKILAYLLGCATVALTLYWYNHIYFSNIIPYWKLYLITLSCLWLITNKATQQWWKYPASILLLTSVVCQICSWLGLVELPLIK